MVRIQAAVWRQYKDRRRGRRLRGQTRNDYRRSGIDSDCPAPHQCKVSRMVVQGLRMNGAILPAHVTRLLPIT